MDARALTHTQGCTLGHTYKLANINIRINHYLKTGAHQFHFDPYLLCVCVCLFV